MPLCQVETKVKGNKFKKPVNEMEKKIEQNYEYFFSDKSRFPS